MRFLKRSVVVAIIAGVWSLFQLALPKYLLISTDIVRCIHLAFAMSLVFLSFPMFKREDPEHIHPINFILTLLAGVVAVNLAMDYVGIAARQGMPSTRDMVMGVVLVLLLLEAARRSLSWFLPIIAGLFITYSFFSESMPEIVSFKNATLGKVVGKLTMGTEGIFGIPLDVSASVIFLFVLFGAMLNKAGAGKYFIELAFSLLGKFRGGPAKAAVLASGLTGMISGSGTANTVMTGTFTIPLMKKAGYPAVKAGAIEVAASTNGQLMPPIMGAAAFIIAEYCNIGYFEVVRAAFVPAIISYIALIYITHLEACKLGLKPTAKKDLPRFRKTFIGGIHFLIPLGFLLYQLIIARRSAGLSVYHAIIVLALLILVKNLIEGFQSKKSYMYSIKRTLREWWESCVEGGKNMMSIGVAVAAAGIIVGIVTLGLGSVVIDVIDLVSQGNLIIMLIVTALCSLLLGMGLPTTANYVVMATLTVPAIVTLSDSMGFAVPLIAAHLFCFYFGILADDTPPVGLAAYAAAAISKADPIKTGIQGFRYDMRTALLPFMFIFNTDLLLIGVNSWWYGSAIFVTGVIAMFAFAALTQNFFIKKNRLYESFLLLAAMIIIFRPGIFQDIAGGTRFLWFGVGLACFALTYALQKIRS